MKRSELKRKTPMKRSTKPMKKRSPERQTRAREECFGPCADLARTLDCLIWTTLGTRPDTHDPKGQVCVGVVEVDHVRTRGAGGKDAGNCCALCTGHHSERHTIGIRTFEKRYGVNLEAEAQKIADRVSAGGR